MSAHSSNKLFSHKKQLAGKYGDRVPPSQTVTEKWPVLHEGPVPGTDLAAWDFRVFGEVEEERRFTYKEFTALPAADVHCDIHCVTHWSKMDNVFHGVLFTEFIKSIRLKPTARFVIIHAEGGYTANLPLAACMDDDVVWAWKHGGENLSPEHGWPLRLIVPNVTSGRAPSGCAASSSWRRTGPASGSGTATTTTPMPSRKSATGKRFLPPES